MSLVYDITKYKRFTPKLKSIPTKIKKFIQFCVYCERSDMTNSRFGNNNDPNINDQPLMLNYSDLHFTLCAFPAANWVGSH